jgi:hypothetical protein
METSKVIHWNTNLEIFFTKTGERTLGLSVLHKKSEAYYSYLSNFINLPVIILGTLNGATSIGSSTLFGDSMYASVGIGCVALLTALLTTINSYFAWSRRAENHKISALYYGKLHRLLSVEMSLPRNERMDAQDLLKLVKNEFDRLHEISPLIPQTIIEKNRSLFEKYKDVCLPLEMNGLEKMVVFDPEKCYDALPHTLSFYKTKLPKKVESNKSNESNEIYSMDIEGKTYHIDFSDK